MAKRVAKENLSYEIKEIIGQISPSSDTHNWCKVVLNAISNGEDTVDIRRMEVVKNIVSKGISLTKTETDALVDLLLDQGYGSYSSIQRALEDREKLFKGDTK